MMNLLCEIFQFFNSVNEFKFISKHFVSPKSVACTSIYWRRLQKALVVPSLRHWLSFSGLCPTVQISSGFWKSYLSPCTFWFMFKVLLHNCDFHIQLRFLYVTKLTDGTVNQPLCEELEAQSRARARVSTCVCSQSARARERKTETAQLVSASHTSTRP